jgi:pimeloyl-ACP methyl ester carboxylesterase
MVIGGKMTKVYKSESGRQLILKRYQEILDVWPVANKQYHIKTNYGSTFVIESGRKDCPALLLLHGSVSNSFAWFGDVSKLSDRFNVYAVDIIGEAGYSAPERPKYESGAYAEWLREVIQGLGLTSCSVVGLSLGGWMALSFATTFPELLEKLILLCPGGLAKENAGFIPKVLFYSLFGRWGAAKIQKIVNGGKSPTEFSPNMNRAMEFISLIKSHFRPRIGKLPIFDARLLSRLTVPVMLVFGEKDYLLSAEKSIQNMRSAVPHARIDLLPDTGHIIVNQADRIMDFLST